MNLTNIAHQQSSKAAPQAARRYTRGAAWLNGLAWLAFAAALVTLPWRLVLWRWSRPFPPIYADFTDILLGPQDVFLLLTLVCWGAALWQQRQTPLTGPLFMWLPLVGLTITAWLSLIGSADPLLTLTQALRLTMLLGAYLFVLNAGRRMVFLKWIIAAQLAIQSIVGLAQFFLQHDVGLQWLGEHRLTPLTDEFVWAEGGLRALRAYGLSDHPNILAIGVVLSLLFLIAYGILVPQRSDWVIWVLIGLGTAVLFTTFSRTAWTAFVFGLALIILGWRRFKIPMRWRTPFPLLFGLLGAALMVEHVQPYLRLSTNPDLISARLDEMTERQAQRQTLNLAANKLFIDHAIRGTGMGTMPTALQQVEPDFTYDYQPAPVNVFTVAAEIGLLGTLFYSLLLLLPWVMLLLRRRRALLSQQPHLLIGMSAVLLAVTLLNFNDAYTWFYPAGRFWQWVVWGVWAAAYLKRINRA